MATGVGEDTGAVGLTTFHILNIKALGTSVDGFKVERFRPVFQVGEDVRADVMIILDEPGFGNVFPDLAVDIEEFDGAAVDIDATALVHCLGFDFGPVAARHEGSLALVFLEGHNLQL